MQGSNLEEHKLKGDSEGEGWECRCSGAVVVVSWALNAENCFGACIDG